MIEPPVIAEVIRALDEAALACGVRYFMVGRQALEVRLKDIGSSQKMTETKDIDFALMVCDWSDYQALRDILLNRAEREFIADSRQQQRLIFRHRLPVVLIPAGEIADEEGSIRWPPDGSVQMNVQGFADACEAADPLDLGGVLVRVASLPGLVLLKLLAWSNHRYTRTKDLEGLAAIMTHYDACNEEERLYSGPDSGLVEAHDFDFTRAWIRILGRDLGRMVKRQATKQWLLEFLRRESEEPYDLAWQLKAFIHSDFDKSLAWFESFAGGVRDALASEPDHA